MFWIFFQESNPEFYDKLKSSKTDIAYLTEMFSKFNEVNLQRQGDETSLIKGKSALSAFLSKLQLYSRNLGRREFRQFPCLSNLEKKTGVKDDDVAELHSQIQRPIFSWNPWLGDRSVYWTKHRSAYPSKRGTCKFAKWRGSEIKVQNLLPRLLDANSDPKTLPYPVERHQVVFHCFSDFPPCWEGIRRCVQAPHQTKKQTQHNRARWSETAPDKPSSWCWQFDCNAPSPTISLSRVVVNDYLFSFTIYFMFSSWLLWLKNKCQPFLFVKIVFYTLQTVCDWRISQFLWYLTLPSFWRSLEEEALAFWSGGEGGGGKKSLKTTDLEYSNYCLQLYCYIHNVSANFSFDRKPLKTHCPKRCKYDNKGEGNSPITPNDKNYQASS